MRHGLRFIPKAAGRQLLQRGYLGGPWFDEGALVGIGLELLADELCIMAPATRRCLRSDEITVFRFPVTRDVLLHTETLLSRAFGGRLPSPSPRYPWRGNGFAPGPVERLEHFLLPIAYPEGTELGRWSATGFSVLQRFTRGQWQVL